MGTSTWIHRRDLEAEIPGRPDTGEHRAICAEYLEDVSGSGVVRARLPGKARQARAVLAAAQVRAAASASREAELEGKLELAHQTIDRLLAFVPARAASPDPSRVRAALRAVSDVLQALLPNGSTVTAVATPESDTDTEACTRLVVSFRAPGLENNPAEIARLAIEGHRAFAQATTAVERVALRLIVEPDF